jgi:HNH endonuclease
VNPLYGLVSERAGHRCEYCRAPEAIFNLPFEVEHVVPTSKGGADDESNCALACRSCNLFKSNHLEGYDEITASNFRLFHPREERWHEHFGVDKHSGSIIGLTSVARATLSALQMNRTNQLAARLQWIRIGLYP